MSVDSGRLVAVSADGFVCGVWRVGERDERLWWLSRHHEHACTVSTVPADEQTPGIGERWTPPGQREDVS